MIDDVGEFFFFRTIHNISSAAPGLLHAHIKRAIKAEREATFGFIKLHGGDADIKRHTIKA